jgi:peptide/nickel transport system substrate-binding protein
MRTTNRLPWIGAVLLIIAALGLSACGGGAASSGDNQLTAAPVASGGTGSAAASAAPAPADTSSTVAPAPADTSGAAGNSEIVISLNADPPKLDPAQSSAFVDRQVLNNICDKLADIDAQGKIVPMLATEWTISDDKLAYTFRLREGVKFHDGTDFNADAVKANLARDMTDKSPRRTELSSVQSVDVVDSKTVKFTLKQPFAPFLSVLTDRSGMIVSPKAAQEMGDDFLTKPVCSGPFMFQDRVKGDHITLVRNPNYWQPGLPKAAKLTYKIFTDPNVALVNLRSGQVDFIDSVPAKEVPNVQQDSKFAVVNQAGFGYQGIYLNTTKPPLDNKAVRKAIDLLIDRDALVKVVFSGTATPGHSPFAPSHFAFGDSDKYDKPNLDQAKKLLADAGVSNVSFTLKTGTAPVNVQVAQLIQNFLKPAGIDMQIEKLEFGTQLDQTDKGDFQASALGWSGRPDPDLNIYDFVFTGGANNDSQFTNPTVDEQLKIARAESDEAKRKAAYDQVMQVLKDEVPYVYLYHQNNVFAMSAQVTGYTYVADGIIRAANMSKQ